MAKLTYSLWFKDCAADAVNMYADLFEEACITGRTVLPDTPSGDVEIFTFTLGDMSFSAMSAGEYFKLNESMSIMVNAKSKDEMDRLYAKLSKDGLVRMPLSEYDFSPYYVWVEDRYGLNWQLMLSGEEKECNTFSLCLLFGGVQNGKAASAMDFYREKLGAKIRVSREYTEFPGKSPVAKIVFGSITLLEQELVFMDHGMGGDEIFTGAFSLVIECDNQSEIDGYWEILSQVPEAEACGWCQDHFGITWQIVPEKLTKTTMTASRETLKQMQEVYYPMKKFIMADLEEFLD